MSNDKPNATAVIKFYPNKRIEVSLDSIASISPRSLSIAANLLNKRYRSMKGAYNAKQHKLARAVAAQKVLDDAQAEKDFHEAEDKRLQEPALGSGDSTLLGKASSPELGVAISNVVNALAEEPDEPSDNKTDDEKE